MTLGIPEILAVALTVTQVFTKPADQFQTHFDPATDQAKVAAILSEGCKFMTKEMASDDPNLDVAGILDHIAKRAVKLKAKMKPLENVPAAGEPPSQTLSEKLITKIDFEKVKLIYSAYCKGEKVDPALYDLNAGIEEFNNSMRDLPDPTKLKGLRLPGASMILDRDGNRFTEVFAENGRRTFVPLSQLPPYVTQAFISAEDQNFYKHKGIEISGVLRALKSFAQSDDRPQGGSTITQQVVKNLLVGDKVVASRKMREIVTAVRLEDYLTRQTGSVEQAKKEILELYVNYIFLGRASWGIEMAAKSYFGKSARDLTLMEAAFLAGLTKGPGKYSPDRAPDLAKERLVYVLGRMAQDGVLKQTDITPENLKFLESKDPMPIVAFEAPRQRAAYYFLDEIQRDAKAKMKALEEKNPTGTPFKSLTDDSYVVRSTIHPELQKAAEIALQTGLMDYEKQSGRAKFTGPAGSIAEQMANGETTWQEQVAASRGNLWDIRWPLAVFLGNKLQTPEGKVFTTKNYKIGLQDGNVIDLKIDARAAGLLKVYDLVYIKLSDDKKSASLLIPPKVQGAIVAMEAKTGRILALSGGFSYAQSQLDRVTQSLRQPGSTLKPFIYLSALRIGYQPNTLIPDTPVNLPPIQRGAQWWSPKNFDGGSRGTVTIRQAIEKSLNLPTARIMKEMGDTPTMGLDYIRAITQELGIYDNPIRIYPFVLGAQPTRLIDMVTAYATISNATMPVARDTKGNPICPLCLRPVPHFIESIEQNGKSLFRRLRAGETPKAGEDTPTLLPVPSLDRVSLYQLRRILQGTVERGTAVSAKKELGGIVAGKTGTSNDTRDAWFVGFTNDIVVGVWIGYDDSNVASGLGSQFTGGKIALPIAKELFMKSFEVYRPAKPLDGVPADLQSEVIEYPIDVKNGNFNQGQFMEVFRLGQNRGPVNTQRSILSGGETGMVMSYPQSEEDIGGVQTLFDDENLAPEQRGDVDYYQPGHDSPTERFYYNQNRSNYYQ